MQVQASDRVFNLLFSSRCIDAFIKESDSFANLGELLKVIDDLSRMDQTANLSGIFQLNDCMLLIKHAANAYAKKNPESNQPQLDENAAWDVLDDGKGDGIVLLLMQELIKSVVSHFVPTAAASTDDAEKKSSPLPAS